MNSWQKKVEIALYQLRQKARWAAAKRDFWDSPGYKLLRIFLLSKESAIKEYIREMDDIEHRYCRIYSRYKSAFHQICSADLGAM